MPKSALTVVKQIIKNRPGPYTGDDSGVEKPPSVGILMISEKVLFFWWQSMYLLVKNHFHDSFVLLR